jgi:putative ABC transport system substrate-binding protein
MLGGCQLLSRPVAPSPPVRRIGYLNTGIRCVDAPRADAFAVQLCTLGWVEGENILVEWGYSDGRNDVVPEWVAGLVQLPVEVNVAAGVSGTEAAPQATSTIPIVMLLGPSRLPRLSQA